MNQDFNYSPIVIGGVGGSGTRVVAQIVKEIGYYIGNDLNEASDNLLYTLLFKRPKWFYSTHKKYSVVSTGLNLFEKMTLKNRLPTIMELVFMFNAVITMSQHGHNKYGDGKGKWPLERIRKQLFNNNFDQNNYVGWGWKEPNSFLLLDHLARHYCNLKYIHVIRHGLDMAFSSNKQQLYNWAQLFGVTAPKTQSDELNAALSYWVKANRHIINIGQRIEKNKFLLVKYDDLCLSPRDEIYKIVAFLGADIDELKLQKLIDLPKVTESIGKYKKHDISKFKQSDIEYLKKLGFEI